MSETTSVFKPHRGTKTVMDTYNSSKVLKSGELFVEGQGSSIGTGKAKIKIGDGTTAYSSLPYALGDISTDPINYTYISHSTVNTALSYISSGTQLGTILASLRRAIYLLNYTSHYGGISNIVNAVNSKAGTTLVSNASPSDIATVIGNLNLSSTNVMYRNLYAGKELKSSSTQSANGDIIDITRWSECYAIVRKTGSGYGNCPQGGVYIDGSKVSAAFIGSSDGVWKVSGTINCASNTELQVRATALAHANATSSNPYTQGIRAYIAYALK